MSLVFLSIEYLCMCYHNGTKYHCGFQLLKQESQFHIHFLLVDQLDFSLCEEYYVF
jgi:hypothetical protein